MNSNCTCEQILFFNIFGDFTIHMCELLREPVLCYVFHIVAYNFFVEYFVNLCFFRLDTSIQL